MSALKRIPLESGGLFYIGFEGNILKFTEADRKLLSIITDAIQEHEKDFISDEPTVTTEHMHLAPAASEEPRK